MKIVLFGDEESAIMFHLLGIQAVIHEDPDDPDFETKFDEILEDPDVGIIMITEQILIRHKDYILPIKMERRSPIIVEIPEMITKFREDYVNEIVKKYIGISIKQEGN